jgi:hypothetical protein
MKRIAKCGAAAVCVLIAGATGATAQVKTQSKIDLYSHPSTTPTLDCGDFGSGKIECRTPNGELDCGTWDSNTSGLLFNSPAGQKIQKARGVTVGGQEVFDVTITAQTDSSLTCQWHCSGSHKIGGPGGYVVGYCTSDPQ